MTQRFSFPLAALALALAAASPTGAQASDPLTRFLEGLIGTNANAPAPSSPAPAPPAASERPVEPSAKISPARPQAAAKPKAETPVPVAATRPAPPTAEARPVVQPARIVAPPAQVAPVVTLAAQRVPTTPDAALDRINAYFNSIDQLTASFVQTNSNGQRMDGSLALKRPGQLRFAYAPPSTLEIVSDGRSVAIRDKKLGTNDVYPVGQTPLKFLLKDQFNLARDVKVQDVQLGQGGLISVRFEDNATLGGTSRITLRFDARGNQLKQWTVIDPQGYETTVVLSDVNMVTRAGID
jgi:outer membrane lipoprotein-sorting protein